MWGQALVPRGAAVRVFEGPWVAVVRAESVLSGQERDGHHSGECGDGGLGPGPGFRQAEVAASSAGGESGGDVEEAVAQRFRFAGLQRLGQREQP